MLPPVMLDTDPASVTSAFAADRAGLRNPALTVEAYLAALDRNGLVQTAVALRPLAHLL